MFERGRTWVTMVYLGRTRLEIQLLRSKRALKIKDSLGYSTTSVALADLFDGLNLDQLHDVMSPIFQRAQVARERDLRQMRDAQRKRIKERDEFTCRYCGRKGDNRWGPDRKSWHIDHVVPVVAGGTDEDENLVLACQGCNLAKSAKELAEFEAEAQQRSLTLVKDSAS